MKKILFNIITGIIKAAAIFLIQASMNLFALVILAFISPPHELPTFSHFILLFIPSAIGIGLWLLSGDVYEKKSPLEKFFAILIALPISIAVFIYTTILRAFGLVPFFPKSTPTVIFVSLLMSLMIITSLIFWEKK